MNIFSQAIAFFAKIITVDVALMLALGVTVAGFIINLILSLSCCGYKKTHRKWFYLLVGISFAFVWSLTSFIDDGKWAVGVYVFFALPISYFANLFKEKTKKITEEQVKLAKFLDKKAIETEPEFIDGQEMVKASADVFSANENLPITPSRVKEIFDQKRKEEFGLDFSHVKNVLKRLDYFALSPSEKRQVKELEVSLLQAESGEFNMPIKERINDGLGALLKIMSKHGV